MIKPITKQNHIYLYFETIRQLKAKSVLDIGMTLKRCGALCRQVADSFIDRSVHLCGVDIGPDITPPVYRSIYQEILTPEEFLKGESAISEYDLGVLLSLPKELLKDQGILEHLKKSSDYLLTDQSASSYLFPFFSRQRAKEITLEKDSYLLIQV